MKPRQTVKNYHNTNAPPYQHQQQQQNSSIPATQLRDIDLAKLVHLDDMPDLQANQANRDEIVKCLQAIYGKNSAELLQKLPALNDWPMQSVSPPDYSRNVSVATSAGNNNVPGSIGAGSSCLGPGFSNNSIHNDSGQHKQDLPYTNSQHSHHQVSAINQFRVSNTSNIHSPQQQKSVLSLHQHHHQNDLSNRRLNHHHHLSSTNASFANLSSATNSPNAAAAVAATSTNIPSDINNLGSSNIGCKNLGPSVVPTHVSNIMDTLGSMDSLFYDGSMQVTNNDPSSSQQSLIRHQQLQKLLRATGSQPKSSSVPQSVTLSSSHRGDLQSQRVFTPNNSMSQNQHPISSSPLSTISPPQPAFTSVPKSLLNLAACSASSPNSTNASSLPPAAKFSSMVNQLNLRSARNAVSNRANIDNSNMNTSNSRSLVKNTSGNIINNNNNINNNDNNDAFNPKVPHPMEQNVIQHANRSVISTQASNSTGPTRSNPKQQYQWSLLSDDQSLPSSTSRTATNLKSMCNVSLGLPNLSTAISAASSTKASLPTSHNHKITTNIASKEAFLASLQERAARTGVSIGETSKTVQLSNALTSIGSTSNNNDATIQSTQQKQNTVMISSDQTKEELNNVVDRNEIESALSRVEARNDLSLLYPPMLLASNSQKQINALSAGLQGAEDSELFTQEVKKIILEECNIIYECKECNNLFRSLANLVKHKRSFCTEHSSERYSLELNKRSYVNNNALAAPQEPINIESVTGGDEANQNLVENDRVESPHTSTVNNRLKESELLSTIYANNPSRCGVDKQQNITNEAMLRIIRAQEKKNQEREAIAKSKLSQNVDCSSSSPLTSLSRILQSQPKQRLPVSRNSALIGALSMAPAPNTSITSVNSLSSYMSDENPDCSKIDVNEQLARNSSLAKTLLNEKARGLQPRQSLIELSKVLGSKVSENIKSPSSIALRIMERT